MKMYLVIILIVFAAYLILFKPFNHSWAWLPFGGEDTQTAEMKNIDNIEVDVSDISTTIIPESRDDLKADLEGKGKLTVKQSGDSIKLEVKRKWFDGLSFFKKKELTIHIPEDYQQNMDIDLGSGNLNFTGDSMKLDELKVDMSSGNIKLKDLATNEFKLDGSSGNVHVDSLTTKTGSFDISSGNINLKHYKGRLEAELSSGKIKAQLDKLTAPINIVASSGKVDLDLPKDADFTLSGRVNDGLMSCDFPLTSKKTDNKNITGTHGSGTHKVNLKVSSGMLKVY